MKCKDFVSSYATGSLIGGMRARLHARRCAQCAAARDWLDSLTSELRAPAELSRVHRQRWEQACLVELPERAPRRVMQYQWAMAGGLALAATVFVVLMLAKPAREADEQNIATHSDNPRATSPATIPLQVSRSQIAEFEQGLMLIATDLDRLADEAARLEARRALSDVAAAYQPLGTPDST